jgi:hypothetical protein
VLARSSNSLSALQSPFVGVCHLGASTTAARRRPPRSTDVAVAAAVGTLVRAWTRAGKITLVIASELHQISGTAPAESFPRYLSCPTLAEVIQQVRRTSSESIQPRTLAD